MSSSIPIILGPTASGKTTLAVLLAKSLGGEVVSADSRQIYRFMDIGTAKPTQHEMDGIPHHFIDVVDPDEYFSAGRYSREARMCVADIVEKGSLPVVAGGSGLYVKALVEGVFEGSIRDEAVREKLQEYVIEKGLASCYEKIEAIDPVAAKRIHPNDEMRILRVLEVYEITGRPISEMQKDQTVPADFTPHYFGIDWPRHILYNRINIRVEKMIESGLIDEVKSMINRGYGPELNSMNSVGYKEVITFLDGEISEQRCVELIQRNSRRYAKRQLTWLRANPAIIWLKCSEENDIYNSFQQIRSTYLDNSEHQ